MPVRTGGTQSAMDELHLNPASLRERAYEAEQAHTDRYPELDLFSEASAEKSALQRAEKRAAREELRASLRLLPEETREWEADLRAKTEAEQLFALPVQSGGLRTERASDYAEPVSAALISLFALLGFGLACLKRGRSRKDVGESIHTKRTSFRKRADKENKVK